ELNGADELELKRMRDELRCGFDQLLELLVRLVDMRVPGAAARGERIAGMALMIAARSDVPASMRRDLEIGARLHEVGRLLVDESPASDAASAPAWLAASRAILRQVDGLRDVADLVGAIPENWDGTGVPNRLNRGQIPFRSRILRVLIDFAAALAAQPGRPRLEILDELAAHQGTLYDPMVLVHLHELVDAGVTPTGIEARVRVPITALEVGMVLAEDLCTDAGLKLLARRTVITPGALDIIRRRHQLEPILEGAVILTRAA
ncbi:MAG TPA: HD domain-containing phosphohydrolase, partial [Terriglobales bacterium]|nr:HD domain-containing phosphohydrolase [Terriglobales bacterium]